MKNIYKHTLNFKEYHPPEDDEYNAPINYLNEIVKTDSDGES